MAHPPVRASIPLLAHTFGFESRSFWNCKQKYFFDTHWTVRISQKVRKVLMRNIWLSFLFSKTIRIEKIKYYHQGSWISNFLTACVLIHDFAQISCLRILISICSLDRILATLPKKTDDFVTFCFFFPSSSCRCKKNQSPMAWYMT